MLSRSDGDCEVVEGDAEPVTVGDVGGDVVVAKAKVLHERVPGGEDPRRPVPFQAPHRPEPGLQPPVICLDGLFAYCFTVCSAEGTSSSRARG